MRFGKPSEAQELFDLRSREIRSGELWSTSQAWQGLAVRLAPQDRELALAAVDRIDNPRARVSGTVLVGLERGEQELVNRAFQDISTIDPDEVHLAYHRFAIRVAGFDKALALSAARNICDEKAVFRAEALAEVGSTTGDPVVLEEAFETLQKAPHPGKKRQKIVGKILRGANRIKFSELVEKIEATRAHPKKRMRTPESLSEGGPDMISIDGIEFASEKSKHRLAEALVAAGIDTGDAHILRAALRVTLLLGEDKQEDLLNKISSVVPGSKRR